jgi:hypothetical protein
VREPLTAQRHDRYPRWLSASRMAHEREAPVRSDKWPALAQLYLSTTLYAPDRSNVPLATTVADV